MRNSILGKEKGSKDEKPLAVVDEYVRENTTDITDPLNVRNKSADLIERRDGILRELDTQIKVANATTFIEF